MKKFFLLLTIIFFSCCYSEAQFCILVNPEAGINNTYLFGSNLSGWIKSGSVGFTSGFNTFAEYNFANENLKIGAGLGFQYQPLYYVVRENYFSAGRHKVNFCFVRTPVYISKRICDELYYTIGLNLKFVLSDLSDSTEFILTTPNNAVIKNMNTELAIGINYTLFKKLDLTIKSYFEIPGFLYETRPEKFIFSNFSVMAGISYKFNIQ